MLQQKPLQNAEIDGDKLSVVPSPKELTGLVLIAVVKLMAQGAHLLCARHQADCFMYFFLFCF